ncbi:MAG: UDP-N-acetylmuramate dehydrogenase, partial [Spirochaetales bacterium]|nr:UDP-N-acetylmuramate dehydrogenase [Spirochaetales bacterium]MCF7937882.1 UDP-N-acetylmuramate dehydrogenase [Spirochaetales bacterium]
DAGIRGLVIDTGRLQNIEVQDTRIRAGAGCDISKVAEHAAEKGLSGLEFIYAMPGSVGGSVWMNARCYGISVSERLESVRYLDENLQVREMIVDAKNFGYKTSPFQDKDAVILDAVFQLAEGDPAQIRRRMEKNREDRTTKGHFRAASAGSTFKNNRDFGSPTGVLIDRLGLKGYQIGGAMVAPYHGNIIINTGNAASRDILDLIRYIERRVYERYGFSLEREVRLIGDWEARHEKSN